MLKISSNARFLERVEANGERAPFFYLADTAWEMLHRLSFEETEFYLRDRASRGFTTIQTVILAEENGLHEPNRNGDLPFQNLDPTQPNAAYFDYVEQVLALAEKLGLVLALLPTWGDKWNLKWGQGPEIFTPQNAFSYGEFLGRRFQNAPNLIWVLGGDRPFEAPAHREIIEQMAAGLSSGGSQHLKTLHPCGGRGSSLDFPDATWLDFHMWQSGHGRDAKNWEHIALDYARTPIKPVLDGEPGYEDHKSNFSLANGFLDEYDNRKALYRALFSGACGHTYGCHAIWQFFEVSRKPVNHPRRVWREALALPGANQMQFARKLHELKPFLGEVPAPEMLPSQEENPALHACALREKAGAWALFYFPSDAQKQLDLSGLKGEKLRASWFNPRNGEVSQGNAIEKTATQIAVPGWGPDWVLILESEEI